MFKVPEKFRQKKGAMGSTKKDGDNGVFRIPMGSISIIAWCIASDGLGWEHVSIHISSFGTNRTPKWNEMCKVKDFFWEEEDCVLQFHPPKSQYVNQHEHCLHLWRPKGVNVPTPNPMLVGIKDD